MAADGTPGTFGTGCTLDHVLAFANAYADVLHCAVEYHDAASIRELRDLHDMANRLSSPACATSSAKSAVKDWDATRIALLRNLRGSGQELFTAFFSLTVTFLTFRKGNRRRLFRQDV